MVVKTMWRRCVGVAVPGLTVVLLSGLSACDQAPTPPPFRPYEEPAPFVPLETNYALDDSGDGSVD